MRSIVVNLEFFLMLQLRISYVTTIMIDIKSTLLKSSDEIHFSINYRYSFSLITYQICV